MVKYAVFAFLSLGATLGFGQVHSGSTTINEPSNTVTYGGASFYIIPSGTVSGSSSGGGSASFAFGSATGSNYIGVDATAPGSLSSSATETLPAVFSLVGSYTGPYTSAPTSLSYVAIIDEESDAYAKNSVTGGSASAGSYTAVTSNAASVGVGTDAQYPDDNTNDQGSSVPGNPWQGANTTWKFSYNILTETINATGNLSHPTNRVKDDNGTAGATLWYSLGSVS